MDSFLLAQVLSAIGSIIFISSVQFKQKRHIIYFLVASDLIGIASVALLGAWGGFTTTAISLLPTLYVYYLGQHRHRPRPQVAWLFWLILLFGWLAVYSSPVDILAFIGSSIYTFSLFQRNENDVRSMLVVNQIAWLAWDLIVGLYVGAFFAICFLASDAIAIMHYRKHRRWAWRAIRHWWR